MFFFRLSHEVFVPCELSISLSRNSCIVDLFSIYILQNDLIPESLQKLYFYNAGGLFFFFITVAIAVAIFLAIAVFAIFAILPVTIVRTVLTLVHINTVEQYAGVG